MRHQSTGPGSSENTKHDKNNNNKTSPRHMILKLKKIKNKEKNLKEARGMKPPYLERSTDTNSIHLLLRNHASKKRVE